MGQGIDISFLFFYQSDKHICLAFIAWSDEEPSVLWQKGLISACVQLRHLVTTLSWVNLATPDWGSTLLSGRAALSAASGLRRDGLLQIVWTGYQ